MERVEDPNNQRSKLLLLLLPVKKLKYPRFLQRNKKRRAVKVGIG